MSLRIAASALNAALIGLRTTANNMANVSTTDFRPSRAEYAERSADGVGRGVQVSRIAKKSAPEQINLAEQLLDMIKLSQQVEAQAAVIRSESKVAGSIEHLFTRDKPD